MIFGVAVSQFIINMRKKDPVHPERWLICYDVALLFVPMALFGCASLRHIQYTHTDTDARTHASLRTKPYVTVPRWACC